MTTATHTELMQIAKEAAAYITKLNGESKTFEIEGDTMTAVIEYKAEIGYDKGDYWTAPCSWVERDALGGNLATKVAKIEEKELILRNKYTKI